MIEGDIFNHDKELPSLDEARTGPKALISKTQAWSVGILSSLPTRGSSRLPAFFLLRHRAARASAACAQILPPQGRRSIWREHGVVRVLCAVHKNARCRAKLCCCCTKCPAARCAVTVGTLGDQGLHTQLTTEINVLRVAHIAHCRTVLHGAQGNL